MSTSDSGTPASGPSSQAQPQVEKPNLNAIPQRVVLVTNGFKPKLDSGIKILNENSKK